MTELRVDKVYNIDCLDGLSKIKDGSVDLLFVDPPYGTTRNKWDTEIPLQPLWHQYERIIKENGVILMFGAGMFTARAMMSKPDWFRYNIIWQKTTPTGFLNANKMPLRAHEDIMVFYKKQPTYNPQKTVGHSAVHNYTKHTSDGTNYGRTKIGISGGGSTERYPTSVWTFQTDKQKNAIHPTQKPIALCRYAIRTYSNPGDLVVDHCCGSGSILAAAALEGRHFIGMDNGICQKPDSKYCGMPWAEIAQERIERLLGQRKSEAEE